MAWLDLRSDIDSLFANMLILDTRSQHFSKYAFFRRDAHLDADLFLAATESEREHIRKTRKSDHLKKWPEPKYRSAKGPPRSLRDITWGRNLSQKSNKLDTELVLKICDMYERLHYSQRDIAVELCLSRETVARALGKEWALTEIKAVDGRSIRYNTQEAKKEAYRLHAEGWSKYRIAKHVGVSDTAVRKWVQKLS